MLIFQPMSSFGDLICEELTSEEHGQGQWHTFEFAVAWVNYYGAEKIIAAAQVFLTNGGSIHATVGLDFGSTTYEGLSSLLDLEDGGANITTHVFFDENSACTFHPKVFLFRNTGSACLYVGSNNMTGAGLETNVEATLGFKGAVDSETIRQALQALAAWRDEGSESRTLRLTRGLLEQLVDRHYVLTEEELRQRRNTERNSRSSRGKPLFGRSPSRPRKPGRGLAGQGGEVTTAPSILREALLMRVRPRRNGKQLQISMRLLEASFIQGAEEVVSIAGIRREIGFNVARGVRNTARFEAPEMMGMQNPVARFQWVDASIPGQQAQRNLQYEVFDAANNAEGARIFKKLEEGISSPPVTNLGNLSQGGTVISTSNRASAQWYRLDSV
ncbi:MAG: phospholipase D family protein [Polaromonas sp.]|nr:phospholipase D family protein [Polaromonas sp.]